MQAIPEHVWVEQATHAAHLQPLENPHGCVSLHDLMRFYSEKLLAVIDTLATLGWMGRTDATLDPAGMQKTREQLSRCIARLRSMDFEFTAARADTLLAVLNAADPKFTDWRPEIVKLSEDCTSRLHDQLKARIFIAAHPDRARYFEAKEPIFGKKVDDAFPSAAWDIAEAGRCYALERHTACVFHLMRALEIALHAFAGHLEVSFSTPLELQNWAPIIEKLEKTINELKKRPKSVERDEQLTAYAHVAMQFDYFRMAWRNHVAHGRAIFGDAEALSIIVHVQEFMTKLADRGVVE